MSNTVTKYTLLSSLLFYSGNAYAAKNQSLDTTIRNLIHQEVEAYHRHKEEVLLKNIEFAWKIVVPNNTISTFTNINGDEETREWGGTGFVVGDKYVTLDHVVSLHEDEIDTPFGSLDIPVQRREEKTYIDEVELISIEENQQTDIAVFQLPEELCKKYCNEGVPFGSDIYIGLDVFWIGNPENTGKTFRYGKIARTSLSVAIPMEGIEGAIGLGTYAIPGDSGSPVFNAKGELLGVIQFSQQSSSGSLGFFKPIEQFRPYLISSTEQTK